MGRRRRTPASRLWKMGRRSEKAFGEEAVAVVVSGADGRETIYL